MYVYSYVSSLSAYVRVLLSKDNQTLYSLRSISMISDTLTDTLIIRYIYAFIRCQYTYLYVQQKMDVCRDRLGLCTIHLIESLQRAHWMHFPQHTHRDVC